VLRFSRLFPIKASLKTRIWKNVKRRLKRSDEAAADKDEADQTKESRAKQGSNFQRLFFKHRFRLFSSKLKQSIVFNNALG
jgi:hypothetical protein